MRWWPKKQAPAPTAVQKQEIQRLFSKLLMTAPKSAKRPYSQELKPYEPPLGVVPQKERKQAMALDATPYAYMNATYGVTDLFFPGYQILAEMAQLPEYRKLSEIIAKEMTRKWIALTYAGDDDQAETLAAIEAEFKRLDLQALFRRMAELDGLFGRGQLGV